MGDHLMLLVQRRRGFTSVVQNEMRRPTESALWVRDTMDAAVVVKEKVDEAYESRFRTGTRQPSHAGVPYSPGVQAITEDVRVVTGPIRTAESIRIATNKKPTNPSLIVETPRVAGSPKLTTDGLRVTSA